MPSIKTVNKEIAKLGHAAELRKGSGYFYFVGEDIAVGEVDAVYVYKINDLTMEGWISEAIDAIIKSKQFIGK